MTPRQRAAFELFGFPNYVPSRPDHVYPEVGASYSELVARYAREGRK